MIDKHTSLDGLTDEANGHPAFLALPPNDRALVRAILLAALRHRTQIEAVIAHRLDRPLPANARALSHHLHVGAAQVLLLDVPDRAAIDLAVEAVARDPRTKRFSGLANAILRRLAREKERVAGWMEANPPGAPDWLEAALRDAYGPERTAAILAAHGHEPPLDITVKGEPAAWAERLGGTVLPNGSVRLAAFEGAVTALPGFGEGEWWVQDAAAAMPARLTGAAPGKRVLDLCAAPGGKTAQLAAMGAEVTAVEINANRARRLAANLERLGLEARVVVGDAFKLDRELGAPFDAVLVDAPCSSTGTIRRHPDVAWTKTPEDVAKLADLQGRLLARASKWVVPGGVLVFANCSLLPEEGEAVADAFLASHAEFRVDPIDEGELGRGEAASGDEVLLAPLVSEGRLRATPDLWPAATLGLHGNAGGMDGFFAARFRRIS